MLPLKLSEVRHVAGRHVQPETEIIVRPKTPTVQAAHRDLDLTVCVLDAGTRSVPPNTQTAFDDAVAVRQPNAHLPWALVRRQIRTRNAQKKRMQQTLLPSSETTTKELRSPEQQPNSSGNAIAQNLAHQAVATESVIGTVAKAKPASVSPAVSDNSSSAAAALQQANGNADADANAAVMDKTKSASASDKRTPSPRASAGLSFDRVSPSEEVTRIREVNARQMSNHRKSSESPTAVSVSAPLPKTTATALPLSPRPRLSTIIPAPSPLTKFATATALPPSPRPHRSSVTPTPAALTKFSWAGLETAAHLITGTLCLENHWLSSSGDKYTLQMSLRAPLHISRRRLPASLCLHALLRDPHQHRWSGLVVWRAQLALEDGVCVHNRTPASVVAAFTNVEPHRVQVQPHAFVDAFAQVPSTDVCAIGVRLTAVFSQNAWEPATSVRSWLHQPEAGRVLLKMYD